MKSIKKWFAGRHASVEISEHNGVRSLHLGGDAIQSAMRLDDPDALELHYTRAMMGFMLFNPQPKDILMLGLGGGSIARFVHRRMETTRMTAVELNPRVVAVARAHFGLPEDDDRMRVVVEDGATYVPANEASADVLLLDAFNDGETVSALCTQRFFDHCYAALRPGGIFAVNFMMDEPKRDAFTCRIERAFDRRVVCLPAGDKVNMIVFGLKVDVRRLPIETLTRDAARLQRRYGLPFSSFVRDLLLSNPRTTANLKLTSIEE
jgi:spermidine synthase